MLSTNHLQIGQYALYFSHDQKNHTLSEKKVKILWIYENETAEVKHLDGFHVELVPLKNLRIC